MRLNDDHEEFFGPKEFLRSCLSLEEGTELRWVIHTKLYHYHKFWTSMESSNLTMLEFGGGPSLYSLISACPHVREIVFAEFTERNCNEVNAWLSKDASAFDWSPYFKHVVQTLEGRALEDSFDREEELRRKISRVIPCDILKQQPLMVKDAQRLKFDVVASTGCVEAAVESDDMFCEAVAKLAKFVKQGGHLILIGFLNTASYWVGNEKFNNFPVSESTVRRALDECGIEILHFDTIQRPPGLKCADNYGDYELELFFAWGILKNGK